jgi:hypothetical protein
MKGAYPVTVKRGQPIGRVRRIGRVAETDEEDSGEWGSDGSPKRGICVECSACGYYGEACPNCPEESGFKCTEDYYSEVDEMVYSSG